jgi:hypothetical protein
VGEGQWGSIQLQLNFPREYYAQVNALAEKAWRMLPSSGLKTEKLSKIRQGPDEPYQDFVSWLLQAVSRLVTDGEAGMILVKCQHSLSDGHLPLKKEGNLNRLHLDLCRHRAFLFTGSGYCRCHERNDTSSAVEGHTTI